MSFAFDTLLKAVDKLDDAVVQHVPDPSNEWHSMIQGMLILVSTMRSANHRLDDSENVAKHAARLNNMLENLNEHQ